MNMRTAQKGFTLVELLVVISIIGILATLLLLQLNVARAKARDTKRVGDINQLRTALELYFDDNGKYPVDIGDANVGKYMTNGKAPTDPSTSLGYGYGTTASETKYQVWAELENYTAGTFKADSDIDATGWSPSGTNGTKETNPCTTADTKDCVFDLGVNN